MWPLLTIASITIHVILNRQQYNTGWWLVNAVRKNIVNFVKYQQALSKTKYIVHSVKVYILSNTKYDYKVHNCVPDIFCGPKAFTQKKYTSWDIYVIELRKKMLKVICTAAKNKLKIKYEKKQIQLAWKVKFCTHWKQLLCYMFYLC